MSPFPCLPGNRRFVSKLVVVKSYSLVENRRVDGALSLLVAMSDCLDHRSTKISLLKEPLVRRLCEVLDKSSGKGWRKLGEIVGNDRRFKVR